MLANFVSSNTFDASMRLLLERFKFNAISRVDLVRCVADSVGFNHFLVQKHFLALKISQSRATKRSIKSRIFSILGWISLVCRWSPWNSVQELDASKYHSNKFYNTLRLALRTTKNGQFSWITKFSKAIAKLCTVFILIQVMS